MNINLDILNRYYADGLLQKQTHPTLPLLIWNYTPMVQYGVSSNQYIYWDEITTQCRGLVTDTEGNVVARPFKKFFNMEEKRYTPTSDFEVMDKMDGSLGILFNYNGEWVFATRGSFTSDQAIKGFEMLQNYDYQRLPKEYTYMFEIIYSDNRIVCQYDFEDLVLLGMIETKTGDEVDLYTNTRYANLIKNLDLKVVKKYNGISDYQTLKGMVKDNEEGFVIKFSNGDRMKIKGEEYLRLHRIMTNVSTKAVWEVLSSGGSMNDLLNDVPDEFFSKIKTYERDLRYNYYSIKEYCGKIHDNFRYGKYGDVYPEPTKKQFADFVMRNYKEHSGILFSMWDRKSYEDIIWKMIKPKFVKL
jgi:RNA ligase